MLTLLKDDVVEPEESCGERRRCLQPPRLEQEQAGEEQEQAGRDGLAAVLLGSYCQREAFLWWLWWQRAALPNITDFFFFLLGPIGLALCKKSSSGDGHVLYLLVLCRISGL